MKNPQKKYFIPLASQGRRYFFIVMKMRIGLPLDNTVGFENAIPIGDREIEGRASGQTSIFLLRISLNTVIFFSKTGCSVNVIGKGHSRK